jgi:hypothetical protein
MKGKSKNAALNSSNKFVFVEATVVHVDEVQMYAGVGIWIHLFLTSVL